MRKSNDLALKNNYSNTYFKSNRYNKIYLQEYDLRTYVYLFFDTNLLKFEIIDFFLPSNINLKLLPPTIIFPIFNKSNKENNTPFLAPIKLKNKHHRIVENEIIPVEYAAVKNRNMPRPQFTYVLSVYPKSFYVNLDSLYQPGATSWNEFYHTHYSYRIKTTPTITNTLSLRVSYPHFSFSTLENIIEEKTFCQRPFLLLLKNYVSVKSEIFSKKSLEKNKNPENVSYWYLRSKRFLKRKSIRRDTKKFKYFKYDEFFLREDSNFFIKAVRTPLHNTQYSTILKKKFKIDKYRSWSFKEFNTITTSLNQLLPIKLFSQVIKLPYMIKYLFLVNNKKALTNHFLLTINTLNQRLSLIEPKTYYNIFPEKQFRYFFLKKIINNTVNNSFKRNTTPVAHNHVIRFFEHLSGKKAVIQFYPFMAKEVSNFYIVKYRHWIGRMNYYERKLGHRFFLEEAIHIIHLGFFLKDSSLISS